MMRATITAEQAHAAAARGAKWMDNHCPGWEHKVDVKVLDMSHGMKCILGQTAKCLVPTSPQRYPQFVHVEQHFAPVARNAWSAR
jgi:hypothetical protein